MVCWILCGPNVPTFVSCRPGVESDTTTGDSLEHVMYGPRHGWISFGFGPSVL